MHEEEVLVFSFCDEHLIKEKLACYVYLNLE